MKNKRVLIFMVAVVTILLTIPIFSTHSYAATYAADYNFMTQPSCTYTTTCPGHSHSFEAYSTCSGCSGYGSIAVYSKCSNCGGDGVVTAYKYCGECGRSLSNKATSCSYCNSSTVKKSTVCKTCNGSGTVKSGSTTCTRCNGKGVNTRCTNSSCLQGYNKTYDYWPTESGYSSLCYKCSSHTTTASTHTLNSTAITNKNDGYYYYTCRVCGKTYLKYANPYTISFNSNGGKGEMSSISTRYRNDVTLPTVLFAKPGYTFAGWLGSNGTIYGDKQTVSQLMTAYNGTFTMNAQWIANEYCLKFDPNGGSVTQSEKIVTYGGVYGTLPTPIRTGYTFKGWYTLPENGEAVTENTIMNTVGNVTIYAQWEINTYTVTYNVNDGNSVEKTTETYKYGSYVDLTVEASKTNHLFIGWNTEAAANDGLKTYRMPAHDVTLYAIYTIPYSDIKTLELHVWPTSFSYQTAFDNGAVITYPITNIRKSGINYVCVSSLTNATVVPKLKSGVYTYAVKAIDNAGNETFIINDIEPPIAQTRVNLEIGHYMRLEDGTALEFPNATEIRDVAVGNGETPATVINDLWTDFGVPLSGDLLPDGYVYNPNDTKKPSISHLGTKKTVNNNGEIIIVTTYYYYASMYYEPYGTEDSLLDLELSFDLNAPSNTITWNDGTQENKTQKMVYNAVFGDLAGEYMPLGMSEDDEYAYVFDGWYTEREGGTKIRSSDICKFTKDTTLYAHWQKKMYQVYFHYDTNGGTSIKRNGTLYGCSVGYGKGVALVQGQYTYYGAEFPLSKLEGVKSNYYPVGWNTDPNATTSITTPFIIDKKYIRNGAIHLYAIYEHKLRINFKYIDGDVVSNKIVTSTIYNNDNVHIFDSDMIPNPPAINGWTMLGYSKSTSLNTSQLYDFGQDSRLEIDISSGIAYNAIRIVYAVYEKNITLNYDTNGGNPSEIQSITQTAYMHTNQMVVQEPRFKVTSVVPQKTNNSFVCWVDVETGNEYRAEDEVTLSKNTTLVAKWDEIPEIFAIDKRFTLEDAKNGLITEEVLLNDVIGTDKEDGKTTVTVVNYNAAEFLQFDASGSVTVTYQTIDSFGHVTTKTVTVYITDTIAKETSDVEYARFINASFYKDGNNFVLASKGGLEEESIWKLNDNYTMVLDSALFNQKIGQTLKRITFYGTTKEVVEVETGTWVQSISVWHFTKDEIQSIKEFISVYGYGKFKLEDGINKFYEMYKNCQLTNDG